MITSKHCISSYSTLLTLLLVLTGPCHASDLLKADPHQDAIRDIERQLFGQEVDYAECDFRHNSSFGSEPEVASDQDQEFARESAVPWTFIVYIAADNDLRNFATRNIKQMLEVGSNKHINIFAHVDIRISRTEKITRRYFIEKNKITCVNSDDPSSQCMNSGDPKTLVSCCRYAIQHYPARQYALVLWNHGTGPIDPGNPRIINPSELFVFNPNTCKLELDRSIGFLELLCYDQASHRGCCWDDSTGQYLTNAKLESALQEICGLLKGKKIDILAFDACLMANFEIACLVKNYVRIVVASEEVELGTGWNYEKALSLFEKEQNQQALTPRAFATHLVQAYKDAYCDLTHDFTQSAMQLDDCGLLEANLDTLAQLLMNCLSLKQLKPDSVKSAIRASRHKHSCTHFHEPDYIDLYHFLQNLQENFKHVIFADPAINKSMKELLDRTVEEGKQLISKMVFANKVGKNLEQARGISIYFPERIIHPSYPPAPFAKNNWKNFLLRYLKS